MNEAKQQDITTTSKQHIAKTIEQMIKCKLCDVEKKESVMECNDKFKFGLTELIYDTAVVIASDVKAFMKHREGDYVSISDFMLFCRRNYDMTNKMNKYLIKLQKKKLSIIHIKTQISAVIGANHKQTILAYTCYKGPELQLRLVWKLMHKIEMVHNTMYGNQQYHNFIQNDENRIQAEKDWCYDWLTREKVLAYFVPEMPLPIVVAYAIKIRNNINCDIGTMLKQRMLIDAKEQKISYKHVLQQIQHKYCVE